ncbi:hypothetical protein BCR39DRAFT_512886 [Naematelia encephala]|uniref:SCD domain-containing protein n=1 Tax=Naematelia encephala TaxID=71784 RepID=A0A1Y2BMA5_9TREE|nr:hypothetical protein BCR39DRAFT_512886 [Naematelia encephala]
MTSSPLRPIRHTSTYLALKINSALCDVAANVTKDLSLAQRQRESEEKKGGVGAAAQKRLQDAEKRVKEAHERKVRLEEYMAQGFDTVLVHRVRDADPLIRTDCLKELGVWVKKYPSAYIDSAHLSYLVRGCNDPNAHARLETVKAFVALFSKDNFIDSARTDAMRLGPRLVEMALRDVDTSVRINALTAITLIDKTGILRDGQDGQRRRAQVARLLFDQEPRVRKAAAGFVIGMWEEGEEELKLKWDGVRGNAKKRAGKITDEQMLGYLEWKAFASILVQTADSLDAADDPSTSKQATLLTSPIQSTDRASAAVEALYAEVESLQQWQGLVEYLLLDHSTADKDLWLLDEAEENFMLQILIACIKRQDKEDDEDEKTKVLINILPRLFTKHQTDVTRMAGILSIPEKMKLELYLDMRMGAAYDKLWDDISAQFLKQTDQIVLTAAIRAINYLATNQAMATANSAKMVELQDNLFASLRDAIGGEEVSTMTLDEDQLAQLEAVLLRMVLLARSRDLTEVMEDDDQQSSGWDIVCTFAERGEVGYKEEAKMVEYAILLIFLHMTWLFKRFSGDENAVSAEKEKLSERRSRAIEVFQRLSLKDRTNATEAVRRQAFISFVNLHVLFSSRSQAPAAKACPLLIADEVQHRLGGAFQAAVERYASDLEDSGAAAEDELDESLKRAQDDLLFLQLVSVFVGAIRCGVLDVEHAKEPLAQYGRFDSTYDAIVRKLVDVLRDEGIYNKQADTEQHVASSALQTSFVTFLDSDADEPVATSSLARLIASAFIIHGTHFTVLRQIHPDDASDLHATLLEFLSRKLAGLVKQELATNNRDAKARIAKKRAQSLTLFKVLVPLLGSITGQGALKLKARMEEAVKNAGLEVNANKAWDAYRLYEKRLLNIAGRDPNVKLASAKVVEEGERGLGRTNGGAASTIGDDTDRDEDDEAAANGNGIGRERTRSLTFSPPPQAVPAKRAAPVNADDIDDDVALPELDVDTDLARAMDVDNFNFDLEFRETRKERSVSVEPTVKRRRTVKKR